MSNEPPHDWLLDRSWVFVELLRKAGHEPPVALVELLVRWELELAESNAQWAGVETL